MRTYCGLVRILWKEYRAQRSVWLALLCGTILLQLMAFNPGGMWPEFPAAYPFVIALVMSLCFITTAAGILFAGEREEETDQWLAQLPIPSPWLLGAKLFAAAAAITSFVLAALLLATVVAQWANLPSGEIMGDHSEVLPRAMLGAFIWGLFFSLLTRSVLKVLALTAVAEMTATAVAGNIVNYFDHRVYFGVLGCVLIADVWLARRWARGLTVITTVWISAFSWRREPVYRPGWLARAVSCGSPTARTAGALLWREARAARPFLFAWFLLGVFCVDLQMRFLEPEIPTHLLFLLLTPVVCGMMTCLGDQRRGTFRFLTERGVSAATVWLYKQLAWVVMAVTLVTVFVAWDVLAPGRFEESARYGVSGTDPTVPAILHELLRDLSGPLMSDSVIGTTPPTSYVRPWSFACSLGLALFAVGQLASFWIRRTVLIGSAAFVMGLVTIIWHGIAAMSDLPLLWTTWPVSVLLLAATWATCGGWMREEQGLKVRAIRIGWLGVTCLTLVMAGRHLRATQVPVVELPFDWKARNLQSYDRDLSAQSRRLFGDLRQVAIYRSSESPVTPDRRLGALYAQAAASVREFDRELGDGVPLVRLAPELLTEHYQSSTWVGIVMSHSAGRHAGNGELDAAWEDILGGLRVSEYLSLQGIDWSDWWGALRTREVLYDAVEDWTRHPEVTADQLRRSIRDLQRLSVADWSTRPMLETRYVLYRQLFERRGPLWEQVQREGMTWFNGLPVTASAIESMRWTGDDERLIRLMTLLTERSLQRPHPDFSALVPAARLRADSDPSDAEIARWVATSLFQVGDFAVDLETDSGGYSAIDHWWLEAIAHERGTLLILALHAYRQQHGRFPEKLAVLTPEVIADLPHDPYTGGDFGYAPAGFDAPVIPPGARVIPAEQPLLWSAGLNRAVLAYHAEAFESPVGTIPGNRYVASPLGFLSVSPPGTPPAPPDGGQADPERIRFIILGAELPVWSDMPGPTPSEN